MELSSLSRLLLSLSLTLALTACGGGGDDTNSNNNDTLDNGAPSNNINANVARCETLTDTAATNSGLTLINTDSDLAFQIEPAYYAEQSGAILAQINRNSADYHYTWQQLDGEPLTLLSPHSPLLAFEASDEGTYTLQVTVTEINTAQDAAQLTWQESVNITVNALKSNNAQVRVSHQAPQGTLVSLRHHLMSDTAAMTDLTWCIATGPDLLVDFSEIDRPLFTAPNVTTDTLSTLSAIATINGTTVIDDVHILITAENPITSTYFPQAIAHTFAYQANSPYANALEQCVYHNELTESCLLSTLPLIGQQDSEDAMKAAIKARLLVSHEWMADNFMQFLEQMDPHGDFLTLLQSVTAIVISTDIRPSFYWALTGAIYLDPDNLWLTASQRDTISEESDYRSQFGESLNFLIPWRYVKDNDYASEYYSIANRGARSLDSLTPELASLLYHELAHANDYFPVELHSQLQGPKLIDDFEWISKADLLISTKLMQQSPLTSAPLLDLANVSFKGEDATSTQQAYTPDDISGFFSQDHANAYYAYSSQQEDMAMLFEEAMMSYRFGIQRDIAVTDKPANATANNITLSWGQRGRIGEDKVSERFALIGASILPTINAQVIRNALPAPISFTSGSTWAQSLTLTTNTSVNTSVNSLFNKAINTNNDMDKLNNISPVTGEHSNPLITHPPLTFSGER
ncbi:hypothetical protein [uncultured Shewanella sp.]|uniref:hypothetical protein n=1 Tax=uncultured Shewanella sp. TaxID=173975 RepID=UPI002619E239|nr:hypothetical protein [uncultured Shewanella sp.]